MSFSGKWIFANGVCYGLSPSYVKRKMDTLPNERDIVCEMKGVNILGKPWP